ncbi:MAG TPA: hypothetical protein VMV77_04170 [Bacteroidales bacterium]|nr:hypothetical protein [Bacteroidales bacterium]
MDIPEIVKQYIIETQGRMPETEKEIDDYLDLINHSKRYAEAFEMEQYMSKDFMKKFGFKTTDEIRNEYSD